jgi:hypothetical protein
VGEGEYLLWSGPVASSAGVCLLRPIKMSENTVIQEVLDNVFYVRQLEDKLRIKNKGRPPSLLSSLITHNKTKTDRYTRHFCVSQ